MPFWVAWYFPVKVHCCLTPETQLGGCQQDAAGVAASEEAGERGGDEQEHQEDAEEAEKDQVARVIQLKPQPLDLPLLLGDPGSQGRNLDLLGPWGREG